MSPKDLEQVLFQLKSENVTFKDKNLLVGFDTLDDAGVYRIAEDLALVQTLDFFTPIVDDPFDFGRIAASNSLSDIYAMGAIPITAMNIICFPCDIGSDILAEILKGGSSVMKEAGVTLVGGHTVVDKEPKYGLSVTGLIQPGKEITNSRSKTGDLLVLTKPLGVGIVTTGLKYDKATKSQISTAVGEMTRLNKTAAELMVSAGANACTDITGFGLLGHASEIARSSGVDIKLDSSSVPIIDGVYDLIAKDAVPGGARENLVYIRDLVDISDSVSYETQLVLADPQTSGGLLISLRPDAADRLMHDLKATGHNAAIIGEAINKSRDEGRVLLY